MRRANSRVAGQEFYAKPVLRAERQSQWMRATRCTGNEQGAAVFRQNLQSHGREEDGSIARAARLTAWKSDSTWTLYDRLHVAASEGKHTETREIAEILVRDRKEIPDLRMYAALILANVSHDHGAAWKVQQLLDEMQDLGLEPDSKVCHAMLKVLSVHLDHLMRTDLLRHMRGKWIEISVEGKHYVAAGLLREGAFEMALEQLDALQQSDVKVEAWLLDLYIYTLCEAGEIGDAHNLLRLRHEGGERDISRSLWHYVLDKAAAEHDFAATLFIWKNQVNLGFLNPSSGTCLNILTSASRAGDAALATDVFTHLSKRGEAFTPLHYQLLMDAYLASDPPDIKRTLTVLTLMSGDNLQPTPWQSRSLFALLESSPDLTDMALSLLRELHTQHRPIPIAALNLIIEAYVSQKDLSAALKVYKLIHTFAPVSEAPSPTFANIETFNLLLRACRTADPPDEQQASFLVSELLALRVKPTPLTYDRLILVYVAAGAQHRSSQPSNTAEGVRLLDYAYRHFVDMQALEWMPRCGTVEKLCLELARAGDERCWDVLQSAEEKGPGLIEGWSGKKRWIWENVEEVWAKKEGESGENW